eukprot:COSAG06_NODE_589_length_13988_cov_250.649435_6_plen_67_part_00
MNRLMDHQKKRDDHMARMKTIQAKIATTHTAETTAETKSEPGGNTTLRQRKGNRPTVDESDGEDSE